MSASTVKKRGSWKRTKRSTKPELPFVNDVIDTNPIPSLSPVLCNHHFPQLELVSAEDHGTYWVSPQCHGCGLKVRRRKRTKRAITEKDPKGSTAQTVCVHRCSQSQAATHALSKTSDISCVKELSAKQQFLKKEKSHRPLIHNHILVPDTPIDEQGMTLKEKLIKNSRRLKYNPCDAPVPKES